MQLVCVVLSGFGSTYESGRYIIALRWGLARLQTRQDELVAAPSDPVQSEVICRSRATRRHGETSCARKDSGKVLERSCARFWGVWTKFVCKPNLFLFLQNEFVSTNFCFVARKTFSSRPSRFIRWLNSSIFESTPGNNEPYKSNK
jgi:hypothetical protein